jgi:aspartate/methionine/tyrosine aminotransferase
MDSGVDPRVDPVWDLTASNPTRCGFEYDAEAVLRALRQPSALDYDPNPKGILSAREAVARYYAEHLSASEQVAASERASAGADSQTLDPEHIFLTTSTSEAYSFLFRLLCDPGDEVLIAQPSYPLFDFLADLDDVRLVAYPLFYDYGWHLDPAALRERITPRTRAIALVHPNNPTGHFTKAAERAALEEICAERGLALIVDEVFLDYPLEGSMQPSFNAGEHPALTFVLSGLSKVAALPQMKAAWIACFGPEPALGEALARLEVIADTFLSMNAPVQAALPDWLAGSAELQGQIRGRTKRNLRILDEAFPTGGPVTRLIAEAGWYAVLRIPALATDEETALALLRERKVAVHSGDFFGLGPSGWLVVSLLPEEAMFSNGIKQIANYLQDAIEPGVAI